MENELLKAKIQKCFDLNDNIVDNLDRIQELAEHLKKEEFVEHSVK